MRNLSKTLWAAALTCLLLGAQSALAAGPISVSVNGTTYTLVSEALPYQGNEAQFQAQPWWGNPSLAAAVTNAVQYQLGDLVGNPGAPDDPSALVGYGVSGNSVSITYWDGSFNDCPSGCPSLDETYYYVFATASNPTAVPALPLGGLLLLGGLVAAIGVRRLRR